MAHNANMLFMFGLLVGLIVGVPVGAIVASLIIARKPSWARRRTVV